MSAIEQLPPEKLEESKTVFNLYDLKKQGVISVDLVEILCKNLGAYIPSDDIKEFKENNFEEGVVNYDKFLVFFAEHYVKKIDKQQLINAFQFLDTAKTGTINAQDLKHSLMVVGDKLSEKEADELLKPYINKGTIDYRTLSTEVSKRNIIGNI